MKIPGSYCFRGFSFYIPGKLQFLTGEQFLDREEKEVRLRNKKGNFMLNEVPFFIVYFLKHSHAYEKKFSLQ